MRGWPKGRSRLTRVPRRIARFVRALFGGGSSFPGVDDADGGVGVRESRRPLMPTLTGAVALDVPPAERSDVRAVGDEIA
jgi:hypothetical protein